MKPLTTQPEQPVFNEGLIVRTLGFAGPRCWFDMIVFLIGHAAFPFQYGHPRYVGLKARRMNSGQANSRTEVL